VKSDNPQGQSEESFSESTKLSGGISRRQTLRSVGTMSGISLLGIPNIADKDDSVKLPKLVSGDEVVEYIHVPRDWYEHIQHVENVRQNVRKKVNGNRNVTSISVVPSNKEYGGKKGLQIKVRLRPENQKGDNKNKILPEPPIPDHIDGIPVVFGEKSDRKQGCTNFDTSSNVAGGQVLAWTNGGRYGTAGAPFDYNGSRYMLHCAHVFWDDCNSNIAGRVASVQDENFNNVDDIGEVKFANALADITRIDDSRGGNFRDYIDEGSNNAPLMGHVTKYALQNWVSESASQRPTVYQMGVTTGRTSGVVNELDYDSTFGCVNHQENGVRTTCRFGQGDSGGPTYYKTNGDAYLVSLTTHYHDVVIGGTIGCNDSSYGEESSGTGAYYINDRWGYDFNVA